VSDRRIALTGVHSFELFNFEQNRTQRSPVSIRARNLTNDLLLGATPA
jgi:hypothetical protein